MKISLFILLEELLSNRLNSYVLIFTLIIILFAQTVLFGNEIPRPEYPRPQFRRDSWINLNGNWTFALDPGESGYDRGFQKSNGFQDTILVPFAPQSEMSGVGYKDFIKSMWYHRQITIPVSWIDQMIRLNFGAVDFQCNVFIDGKSVGTHFGNASFSFDVTSFVQPGETHDLVVAVRDYNRSGTQTTGKQSHSYHSHDRYYTRTTGIWQTVWMESLCPAGLKHCSIIPDFDGDRFCFQPVFFKEYNGYSFRAIVMEGNVQVAQSTVPASSGKSCSVHLHTPHAWSPFDPFLYELLLQLLDDEGQVIDEVKSYAGMRKIHIEENHIYLNNDPVYLRFALNQGYFPRGVYTAPHQNDYKRDIQLAKRAGFNGVRCHAKIFDPRFHYWADRLGFLSWVGSPAGGRSTGNVEYARNFLSEWRDVILRDRNHPSIIAWVPFDETEGPHTDNLEQHNRLIRDAYDLTKLLDPTRPVNDASGYYHIKTDLWSVHLYRKSPEDVRTLLSQGSKDSVYVHSPDYETDYSGQPYFVDAYGGIKCCAEINNSEASWGYSAVDSIETFYEQLEGLTDAILSFDYINGFCYTQLYDVEQEKDGIYTYDRRDKFDMERIYEIFSKSRENIRPDYGD